MWHATSPTGRGQGCSAWLLCESLGWRLLALAGAGWRWLALAGASWRWLACLGCRDGCRPAPHVLAGGPQPPRLLHSALHAPAVIVAVIAAAAVSAVGVIGSDGRLRGSTASAMGNGWQAPAVEAEGLLTGLFFSPLGQSNQVPYILLKQQQSYSNIAQTKLLAGSKVKAWGRGTCVHTSAYVMPTWMERKMLGLVLRTKSDTSRQGAWPPAARFSCSRRDRRR